MMTLAQAKATEARRRLTLLGATVKDTTGSLVGGRARQVGLSALVLRRWHAYYLHSGLDGLLPLNWPELPESTWELVERRYLALGELAEAEAVSLEDLRTLAERSGWTLRQARRWVQRYRVAGLMVLAPASRPVRPRELPDVGTLSEAQRDELFRRRALLGELAEQEHVSNELLVKQAETLGVSLRTLRDYHTRFRRAGLTGLAPYARADKGHHHSLGSQMVQVIENLRLTHRDATMRFVYELACQHARTTGESVPSLWQVRSICRRIPAPVRLLADGREAEFRNRYRLTYPIAHDAHRIVWQIDHKAPLHVLVRDLRAPSHRSPSGEVRPYLTLVIDSASRLVMAGLFSYDPPDRFMVAAAIRAGMLTTEHKPFGGVPDEIWVDNGKDLIAHHVRQLTEGLGITLFPGPPHYPELRGIVERFHETLDTRLWACLPGYVGANVVERNPKAKAELTLAELEQHFRRFIDQYHQEQHTAIGQTPLQFWQEHATPLPVDERLLDVLLKEPAERRVLKEGIKYGGRIYWHAGLALLVGEDVLVRAAPSYRAPDELEVFFEEQWRCPAFALDSVQGQAVSRQVVADAQRRQRTHARRRTLLLAPQICSIFLWISLPERMLPMIPEYADELDFENRLPVGQAPIMTASVKRFHAYMQFIMQSRTETGYATMGVITGDAGVGKTIALQTYVQSLTPRAYSGFPACVSIKVSPRSTAKALAKTLIATLNGEQAGYNVYDMEATSTEAIRRNDLDLILVDEGDWLNVESFELLRHIFDRTGCPIVIVGLPRIMRVITRHEKFVSRVGLHMEFLPLTQEEVLTTVLPALILPYWHYRVDDDGDREMGRALWQRVCPSFRKLRVVLQYASQIARARQEERITSTILAETFRLTLIPQVGPPRRMTPSAESGSYEAASEQKPPRS